MVSDLLYVPASSAAIPINWSRVSDATKIYLVTRYGYLMDKDDGNPLPATIGDLAKMFDETKFFGYFSPDVINALLDISEFGLQPTECPVGPRFYMTYTEQVWFLLFTPGAKEGFVGCSEDVINTAGDIVYDDASFEKFAADATAMAKAFDVTLQEEISRGNGERVKITRKLGGWSTWTLQSLFGKPQYGQAKLNFPKSSPAFQDFMDSLAER